MGSHINENGQWQSDKFPTTPPDCVPLKVTDETAQDLLWEYAQRRRQKDAEFSADLEARLRAVGYKPPTAPARTWDEACRYLELLGGGFVARRLKSGGMSLDVRLPGRVPGGVGTARIKSKDGQTGRHAYDAVTSRAAELVFEAVDQIRRLLGPAPAEVKP